MRTALSVLVIVVSAASAVGCTSHSKKADDAGGSSSLPVFSTAPVDSPAPASSSAPPAPVLPHDCPDLVPLSAVEEAVGVKLGGEVTYLRAAPVPQSGRTGRVTCGYGTPVATPSAAAGASPTPTPNGQPLVEVSYITYVDADTAAGRVALTVSNDAKTSTLSKVEIDGLPASVLVGSEWNELVMARGASTIVVEVSPTVLSAEKAPTALVALAKAVLAFDAAAPSSPPASSPAP